jgi:transcriptional regulator with XRE-family HTH domain
LFVFSPRRVREARAAAGLTREEAAVAIGRSFQTIRSYEEGRISPPAAMLGRLAAALGVGVEDFFESTTDPDLDAAAGDAA